MENLNESRVEALTLEMSAAVKAHLAAQPHHPDKVFEALNAAAIVVASLIAGANQDPKVIAFFRIALQQQLNAIVALDRVTIPATTKEPH